MRKNATLADMTIVCDGDKFPVQKAILAARSDVFAANFNHKDTLENMQKEIVIEDLDKLTMDVFLSFIYGAVLPKDLSFEELAKLLKAADKYHVPNLVDVCAMKLKEKINSENAVLGAVVGSVYRKQELKRDAK